MNNTKRKIIREKIAKRMSVEDIQFGYPDNNKSHGEITEHDKKNIQAMRDYAKKGLKTRGGVRIIAYVLFSFLFSLDW